MVRLRCGAVDYAAAAACGAGGEEGAMGVGVYAAVEAFL